MVRGALAGWYPYPFLDPANGGYGTVALYVVAILAFGLVVDGRAPVRRQRAPGAAAHSCGDWYVGRLRIPNVAAGQ